MNSVSADDKTFTKFSFSKVFFLLTELLNMLSIINRIILLGNINRKVPGN